MIVLRADYLKYFFYTYLISFSTLIFLYTNNRIKILDLNECYHAKINLSIRLKKKKVRIELLMHRTCAKQFMKKTSSSTCTLMKWQFMIYAFLYFHIRNDYTIEY